jgi:CRP/FNR family cyclic AMP-dependent transcriptional regulator
MVRFSRKADKAEALGGVPMFAGLSKKDLSVLASHVDEVSVAAGAVLAEQGRRGHQLSLIVEGEARVARNGRKLATLGPGDVVGEMSLIDNFEATATVTATTDATLLVMHGRDFDQVLDASPGFARKIMKALSARLREADRKLVG